VPEANKVAYVFPGQGSQKTGMGHDLYESCEPARAVFQKADQVLGFPLSKLCFDGPEEELRRTINAQPALVTMSFACLQAALSFCEKGKIQSPAFVAGHSLGEYTALAVSGVLDFADAVFLARERGRLMQEAGEKTRGGMAAILGMDETAVAQICQETGCFLANINCPGQIVISGAIINVEKAVSLAQSRGAARALLLQVSGAFHSLLMQPAADGMSALIEGMPFKVPSIPVIANTTAQPVTTVKHLKSELLAQLCHSVQWQRSVEYMINDGARTFIEIGAGKVLTGLIKRIDKNVKVLNVSDASELKNILG
jgi:[acyl-carrier-protein] S-malonyltransferase